MSRFWKGRWISASYVVFFVGAIATLFPRQVGTSTGSQMWGTSVISAEEGGGGCNNCRVRLVTSCPDGCHSYEHDFGPLDGCWDGQDCRACIEVEDGGCHSGYHTGTCDLHSNCQENFAVRSQQVGRALGKRDIRFLTALIRQKEATFENGTTLVLHSTCNSGLVKSIALDEELQQDLSNAIESAV